MFLLQARQAHEGFRREEEARQVEAGDRDFHRRKKNESLEWTQSFFLVAVVKKKNSVGNEKKIVKSEERKINSRTF